MPARFWFDIRDTEGAANGSPEVAILGLAGKIDAYARGTIWEFWKNPNLKAVEIKDRFALYMMGTAAELRTALQKDIARGIDRLHVRNGRIGVWHIRRRLLEEDESLICIAGRGAGSAYYCDAFPDERQGRSGGPASHWKEVPGTSLDKLVVLDDLCLALPMLRAETPEMLPAAPGLPWRVIEAMLTDLDRKKNKDKHLRCELGESKLYVHDDRLHSMDSPAPKYAEAVKLIKASIDLEHLPGTGSRIFSNLGISDDRIGLRAGQIGKLLVEIDAQKFRYQSLLELRKNYRGGHLNGSVVALKMGTDFFEMRTDDEAGCSTDPAKWNNTGNKVHISVAATQVADAWNKVLPILLQHRDTIKLFKVTDMMVVGAALPQQEARRVYDGAQITIYFYATPEELREAKKRFVEVIKLVSSALTVADIRSGIQPPSDLPVNGYASFRHSFIDLLEPERCRALREKFTAASMAEDGYTGNLDIREGHDRYAEHMELSKRLPLYKALTGR